MYKFISYGIGTIGLEILKNLLSKRDFELIGVVDIKEDFINKNLKDLVDFEVPNISVKKNIKEFGKCDIVIHSTQSKLKDTFPQLVELLENGYNVISTCEELFFPYYFHNKESILLDEIAKKNGVRILGVGINPGFILDTLPIFLSTLSIKLQEIFLERVLDASKRRKQLQIKIGAGITKEEFYDLKRKNKIGHVGLLQSLLYIFHVLKFNLREFKEELEPLIAEEDIETDYIKVKKGFVRGQYQRVVGISDNNFKVEIKLIMALGEKKSFDRVILKGKSDIEFEIKGGVQGDLGTAAVVANYIPILLESEPGLHITSDLKLPHYFL